MMRVILDVRWFSGRTNVGIVKVETEYDGIRYYIGEMKGYDEETDKEFLADWGASFPKDAGDVLFGTATALPFFHLPLPRCREDAENMIRLGHFYLEHSEENA